MPIVKVGARLLYNYGEGRRQIYEYRRRPLHGKVALMDDHWATVGSSNLDPLSLSLNLEANLIIHDRQFNQTLRDNLQALIVNDCVRVDESMVPKRTGGTRASAWWCSTSCGISGDGRLAAGAYAEAGAGGPAGTTRNGNPDRIEAEDGGKP